MKEIFESLKKYNYWHKEAVNIGFKRDVYVDRLKRFSGNRLIKVLLGQRRVGKSYVMQQMIADLIDSGVNRKNIFYLNKELVEFDAIKNFKDLKKLIDLYKKELKVRGKIFIFIDEVQEIDGWEKIINSLSQDYKEEYEVYITGSNSKMLSGELATYLSGRYVTLEIYSFSFDEYVKYFKLPKNKESYIGYLKTGGLPEIYKLIDTELKVNYIGSLKNTIFLKDIVHRYDIKDSPLLDDLIKFVINNIGNFFSINKIVNYLGDNKIKVKHETIANYMHYTQQTFLVHKAERYDIKGKAILSGNKKYYINDLAFKNYLSSNFDPNLGKHLENAIFLHYKTLGYKVYVGKIGDEEVDFVLEKGKERKYVQVAFIMTDKKVIEREFRSLEKINDSYEKIVVSLDDMSLGNKNGIKHILAWEL